MSEKQPKSAVHEGKEFIFALKKQNPLIFWSIISTIVIFFIPLLNLFLPFYWAGVITYKLFPKLKTKVKKLQPLVFGCIGLFIGITIVSSIPVFAYYLAIPTTPKQETVEVVKEDTTKINEEKQKREQAEKEVREEREKRENEEKSKKELQDKIDQATKINPEYDQDSDIEQQTLEVAKQANLAIAPLGNNTQNQKLFDVISVVDGDTIKVSELGTLRLIGMDTPETKDPRKPVQCFGVEASNRAKDLLNGKKVYLEFDPSNRIDKYGRTLAYVYREDGYFYNKEMVKDGYANSYTKYPHPKMDEFNQVAKEARENQRGLWSPSTCNGDATQPATKASTPATTNTASSKATTTQPAPTPAPVTTPKSTAPSTTPSGYIAGSCKELKSKGLGNFKPGDPNYTASRDGNSDGVACEL